MVQDIPKLYTALAEWLACVFLLIEYRKFMEKKCLGKCAAQLSLAFVVLCILQYFCGLLSNALWLVGMACAVMVMVFTIRSCLQIALKTSVYICARAFLKAEFLAALEWQVHVYYFADGAGTDNIWLKTGFCLLFYLAGYTVIGYMEYRLLAEKMTQKEMEISIQYIVLVWSMAILVFALSNLSYVSVKTPFSGTDSREIFNIRTLFDLTGLLMMEAFHLQKLDADRKNETDVMNMLLQKQYMQFRMSQENIDLINRKYHDLKHQIQIIREEVNDGKRKEYLDEIAAGITRYESEYKTGNSVLDTILSSKSELCLKNQIVLTVVADGTLLHEIHVMDLCTIFGNALDNAIEHEVQIEDVEKRKIRVTVSQKNKFVCIVVENYFEGEMDDSGHLPQTTKKDKEYHGYGLKSIRHAVQKYGGYINVHGEGHWFRLEMIIPLKTGI